MSRTGIITSYLRMRRIPHCYQRPAPAFSLRKYQAPVLPFRLWPERLDRFEELCGRGHVRRGEDNRVSTRAVDARNV